MPRDKLWWRTRIAWAVAGGAWGAWVGFGGYFRLAHNADSFAMLFAAGFFVFFALIGLVLGAGASVLVGGWTEALLRRLGMAGASAVVIASLVNAFALWQAASLVWLTFPGLRPPPAEQPAPPGAKAIPRQPCATTAPTDPVGRKSWEAECR